MKIQEDLVWHKNTGELIGFVDQVDKDLNFATLENVIKLVTQVLIFLSFSFATFSTSGITAFQFFPIFFVLKLNFAFFRKP